MASTCQARIFGRMRGTEPIFCSMVDRTVSSVTFDKRMDKISATVQELCCSQVVMNLRAKNEILVFLGSFYSESPEPCRVLAYNFVQ